MIENGLYIVKDLYFSMFEKYGCKFKQNKQGNRPTFCCIIEEILIKELNCEKTVKI